MDVAADVKSLRADVLVVGGGLAGLCASIAARVKGASVVLADKFCVGKPSCSYLSVGAFRVAAEGYVVEEFIKDAFEAGRSLNNPKLVQVLAKESFKAVKRLEELGVDFKFRRGSALTTEVRGIARGAFLIEKLARRAEELGVELLPYTVPVDVKRLDESCWLAYLWRWRENRAVAAAVKSIVIASGGVAGVYWRTTNPPGLTGDGHILAMKAGAKLIDMEFIQFFPFTLADRRAPAPPIPILVELKGRLFNIRGEDVARKHGVEHAVKAVEKYRDLVSRVLMRELVDTGSDYLLLDMDLSLLGGFAEHFNLKPPLKVAPAAHFSMGGILADENGFTGVEGVYVAGEAMGGVHGANRLAMNALTACAVYGFRAGEAAANHAKSVEATVTLPSKLPQDIEARLAQVRGKHPPQRLLEEVQKCMWFNAGILRSKQSLLKAKEIIREVKAKLEEASMASRHMLLSKLELENALTVASAVVEAALLRRESRGAHHRQDYPSEEESLADLITVAAMREDGKLDVTAAERSCIWL